MARLRTIGDLLTSIIHPTTVSAEKDAATRQPAGDGIAHAVVNDYTTVTKMIGLVTFLQPRFTEIPPPPTCHQLP